MRENLHWERWDEALLIIVGSKFQRMEDCLGKDEKPIRMKMKGPYALIAYRCYNMHS